MFKSLFGGNKEDKEIKQKLQQIETALSDKNFEEVISEGESILNQVSDKRKPDLLKMIGVANFHLRNYDKAVFYFEEMSKLDENNPDYLYNISSASILNKQPEKGLEILENAITLYQTKGKKENMPVSYMIFYTICALIDTEEFNLAFDQLDRLSAVYKDMSITDNQFLYSRGFIPFHTLLEKAKDTLIGQNKVDAIEWLTNFAEPLDEDGQAQVEELIEDLKAEQEQKND